MKTHVFIAFHNPKEPIVSNRFLKSLEGVLTSLDVKDQDVVKHDLSQLKVKDAEGNETDIKYGKEATLKALIEEVKKIPDPISSNRLIFAIDFNLGYTGEDVDVTEAITEALKGQDGKNIFTDELEPMFILVGSGSGNNDSPKFFKGNLDIILNEKNLKLVVRTHSDAKKRHDVNPLKTSRSPEALGAFLDAVSPRHGKIRTTSAPIVIPKSSASTNKFKRTAEKKDVASSAPVKETTAALAKKFEKNCALSPANSDMPELATQSNDPLAATKSDSPVLAIARDNQVLAAEGSPISTSSNSSGESQSNQGLVRALSV